MALINAAREPGIISRIVALASPPSFSVRCRQVGLPLAHEILCNSTWAFLVSAGGGPRRLKVPRGPTKWPLEALNGQPDDIAMTIARPKGLRALCGPEADKCPRICDRIRKAKGQTARHLRKVVGRASHAMVRNLSQQPASPSGRPPYRAAASLLSALERGVVCRVRR
jgi:hypothetical protein